MKRRLAFTLSSLRARVIYRLDTWLGRSPLVQLSVLFVATVVLVVVFAAIRGGHDFVDALWWAATRFMDGGTMANDASGRILAVLVTAAGIVTLSLLTAALASKMGERIGDLRSGANPVVERDHVLVLGYDANVPLLAREIARSGQPCTLVILAAEDKDKIEASLRPALRVAKSRLRAFVRTGDARSEHALMHPDAAPHAPAAERIAVIGVNHTLPHLLAELDALLPASSVVTVVTDNHTRGAAVIKAASERARRITIEVELGPSAVLCHAGNATICGADAVVILGHEDHNDENGDASALATLLRLRHGMRLTNRVGARVVTELRDPRSASHIVPRPGDCIVSSDLVAMLLAQEALDPRSAAIYRELLHPGGTSVFVRPATLYGGAGTSFAQVMANARARGEIAIGIFPDPRSRERDVATASEQLDEGRILGEVDAWLSPPRDVRLDERGVTRVVVLARPDAD